MYRPLVSKLSTVAGNIAKEQAELWVYRCNDGDDVDLSCAVDGDSVELFDRPILENASRQYSRLESLNLDTCFADDKPLWWLVLRWVKMMLLKIARSYHAKPLLLVTAPLLSGVLIGFWIGRWKSLSQPARSKQMQQTSKTQSQQEQRIQQLGFERLAEFLSTIWYRSSLAFSICMSQNVITTTYENELKRSENSTEKLHSGPVVNTVEDISISTRGKQCDNHTLDDSDILHMKLLARENEARKYLKSDEGTRRESDVPAEQLPRHVAVIMDGNRRYGKSKYGSVAKGHWEGSSKLVEFAKWCTAEQIAVLTVFAFSSENWKRDPSEVACLMQIFAKYCDELRIEAVQQNIKISVLSTDYEKIPRQVRVGVRRMVDETKNCNGMIMNICLSYGSRDEIVGATKSVIDDVLKDKLDPKSIDEKTIGERLLTYNSGGDPDVLIRTSGEVRISNFLLWQLAYTELFFVSKPWPMIEKDDLLEVIRTYAKGRNRRFGK